MSSIFAHIAVNNFHPQFQTFCLTSRLTTLTYVPLSKRLSIVLTAMWWAWNANIPVTLGRWAVCTERVNTSSRRSFNALVGTLKPQSNGPLYSNWYTGRWLVGCYVWYSEEGPGRAAALASPLLAVPNVTAHPSTVSVQTSYYSMWHCNYLCLLKGYYNVPPSVTFVYSVETNKHILKLFHRLVDPPL